MVGISKASKEQYGKNLWGLGAILSGAYLLLLNHPSFMIVLGTFLLWEHIWNFGVFELWDFIGHEYLGLVFIIIGVIFSGSYGWNTLFGIVFILVGVKLNLYTGKDSFSKELKNLFKSERGLK